MPFHCCWLNAVLAVPHGVKSIIVALKRTIYLPYASVTAQGALDGAWGYNKQHWLYVSEQYKCWQSETWQINHISPGTDLLLLSCTMAALHLIDP
jgi:hypothetical protein